MDRMESASGQKRLSQSDLRFRLLSRTCCGADLSRCRLYAKNQTLAVDATERVYEGPFPGADTVKFVRREISHPAVQESDVLGKPTSHPHIGAYVENKAQSPEDTERSPQASLDYKGLHVTVARQRQ